MKQRPSLFPPALAALFLWVIACSILFLQGCRKDSFITSADARLIISADTIKFDTVFTSAGSVTQSFKIINVNNQKLRLSGIQLMGGSSSAYKLNIDGIAASQVTDLDLEANDSVYVFVQVNVDPASGSLPFVIRDSIQVSYNGNTRFLQLEAWGQNAHFMRERQILSDEQWDNDLPYVIQGYLYVSPGNTLTIKKGCRIYVHANAPVIIDGSLVINGEKDTADQVHFLGDRLDDPYRNFPASWPGIYLSNLSAGNVFNHAVIKNAYQGIILEGPSSDPFSPKLVLRECIIDNCLDAGILSVNSSIVAENCLISNCGRNMSLTGGGDYQFVHCTVASYSNNYVDHKEPVLYLSDMAETGSAALQASFQNSIFWGEGGLVDNEVVVVKGSNSAFSVNFDHVLWKLETAPASSVINQALSNNQPLFDSINVSNRYYNFRLRESSPAVDAGGPTSLLVDLDGNSRQVGLPDLGCFERP